MSLQELINQELLKEIKEVSFKQIRKRFALAIKYFNFSKKSFEQNGEEYDEVIYTNLYNAAKILGETLLLLNGYKAVVKDHHKIVIQASRLLMNNSQMDEVFSRLDQMRKKRNIIDYDIETPFVSRQVIEQSVKDIQIYINKVEEFIEKADPQEKLIK